MTRFRDQEDEFISLARLIARQALKKKPTKELTGEIVMATVCLGLADVCRGLDELKNSVKKKRSR